MAGSTRARSRLSLSAFAARASEAGCSVGAVVRPLLAEALDVHRPARCEVGESLHSFCRTLEVRAAGVGLTGQAREGLLADRAFARAPPRRQALRALTQPPHAHSGSDLAGLAPDQIKAAPEYKAGSNPTVVTAPPGKPGLVPGASPAPAVPPAPTATDMQSAAPNHELGPGAAGAGAP